MQATVPYELPRQQLGQKWARALLGLLISVASIGLLLHTLDVGAALAVFRDASLSAVLPALALYFVGTWIRSVRWALLLRSDSDDRGAPLGRVFQAFIIGLAVNNLMPLRLGELARLYLARRWCSAPIGRTLASLVTERLLDGVALAGFLLIALPFVAHAPGYMVALGLTIGGAFLSGVIGLCLLAYRSDTLIVLIDRLVQPRSAGLSVRLRIFVASFTSGLALTRGWRFAVRIVGLSALAWLAELSLYYVLVHGFPGLVEASTLPISIVTGALANFATLVPSSPGYIGTFDSVIVKVLTDLTGQRAEQSAAYALLVHATLYLPVTLLGLFFSWRAQLSWSEMTAPRGAAIPAGATSSDHAINQA